MEPILIAGAGPAGLAFALEAVRLGLPVAIVDKRPQRSGISKATGIAAGVVDSLASHGLAGPVEAQGFPMRRFLFHGDERVIADVTVPPVGARPPAYLFPQLELERAMERVLAGQGVEVRYGAELVDWETRPEGGIRAAVSRTDGTTATIGTPWLIGADGAHSAIRARAGFEFVGRDYPERWTVAEIETSGWSGEHQARLYLGRDGVGLFLSSPTSRAVQGILNAVGVAERLRRLFPDAELKYEREFAVSLRRVRTPRIGAVWVIGDAAHVQSPVGGQGLNLAVWDGVTLARGLAGGAPDAAEKALRRRAQAVLTFTDFDYRMLSTRSPWVQVIRDAYWSFAARNTWAARWFFKLISGVW